MKYLYLFFVIMLLFLPVTKLVAAPIHDAAKTGSVDAVKYHLERGVDFRIKDTHGRTPLGIAKAGNHILLSRFLRTLRKVTYPSGSTYVGQMKNGKENGWGVYKGFNGSIYKGMYKNGKFHGKGVFLYSNGTSYVGDFINGRFAGGKWYAVMTSVTSMDRYGETSLFPALKRGKLQLVKLLIAKGADINMRNKNGQTPLHYAAFAGRTEIARLLIARGAKIRVKDKQGLTPLHLAAFEGRTTIVKLLLKHGARVNVRDIDGMTPLHFTAFRDFSATARVLIRKGAGVYIKDKYGNTALHHANRNGSPKVGRLLRAFYRG